jgi:hypothetical protein
LLDVADVPEVFAMRKGVATPCKAPGPYCAEGYLLGPDLFATEGGINDDATSNDGTPTKATLTFRCVLLARGRLETPDLLATFVVRWGSIITTVSRTRRMFKCGPAAS